MQKESFGKALMKRYVVIVMLCLFFSIVLLGIININYNQKQGNQFYMQSLQSYQSKIDTSISFTTKSISQLIREQSFMEYCLSPKEVNYHMIDVRKSLISKLSLFENYCDNVGIIKLGSDTVLTNAESLSLNAYLNAKNIAQQEYQKAIAFLNDTSDGTYYMIPPASMDSPYLSLLAKYEVLSDVGAYVCITYYKSKLIPELSSNAGFLLFADNTIMLENDWMATQDKKLRENVERVLLNTEATLGKPTQITKGGEAIIISSSQAILGKYVLFIPRNLRLSLLKLFLWICFLVIGIALLFVILNTKRMTLPINDIVEKLQPFSSGKHLNHNELSFISSVTNEIIETNKNLMENLDTKNKDLKNRFILDLLIGVLSTEEINTGMIKYHLDAFSAQMFVVILDFYDLENANHAILYTNGFNDQLYSHMKQAGHAVALIELLLFKSKTVLLFSGAPNSSFHKFLETLIQGLNHLYGVRMIAAIGAPSTCPDDLKHSFNTALGILESKQTMPYKKVLTTANLNGTHNSIYYPLDIEHTLINYVIYGKKSKVNYILSDIMKTNLKVLLSNHALLSDFSQSMSYTIRRCMQLSNLEPDDVFEDGTIIYLELKMCKNMNELKEKLFYIFDKITEYINTKARGEIPLTAENISSYIASNYNRDISLTDIAQYFSLSEQYVSKMIKELTHTNFKKYLNHFRIEKAKQILMENPDIQINEIAEKIGFFNTNTFIRVFNEFEGMSPGKYRKNIMNP